MGSIVITDVVSNIARHPHTMVFGDNQESSSRLERNASQSDRSQRSFNPQAAAPPYAHQRYPSAPLESVRGNTSSSSSLGQYNPLAQRTDSHASLPTSTDARPGDVHTNAPPEQLTRQASSDSPTPRPDYGYDQSGFPLSNAPGGLAPSPPSPRLLPTVRSSFSLAGSGSASPTRIKVRDLNHIQSFASEEVLTRSRHGSRRSLRGRQDGGQQYEISAMPVTDIIEMVAGLLTKITTTNDRQHENVNRHVAPPEGATGLSQQTTSVLAFHGKNVPSITILSYLSRIHKYCPTTYEVFLSLLVYFDRMTEMVNSGTLSSFRHADLPADTVVRPPSRPASVNSASSRVESQRSNSTATATSSNSPDTQARPGTSQSPSMPPPPPASEAEACNVSQFFVVDSFNIHRLVIAGVTCASKFFSDVFYTNSRYAKVSLVCLGANVNV